jgi:hypothetical protein
MIEKNLLPFSMKESVYIYWHPPRTFTRGIWGSLILPEQNAKRYLVSNCLTGRNSNFIRRNWRYRAASGNHTLHN